MKYWCSVCFGWKYWLMTLPVLLWVGWWIGKLIIVVAFACCEKIGYWWLG